MSPRQSPQSDIVGHHGALRKLPTQRTAALAKQKGLDVDAIEVSGDHFSSMPEAIRMGIEFFKDN
jgi:hypothetical protein